LSLRLCVCSALPALRPRTHVVIMAHRVELAKTTNTGRLVARMLGERAELVRSDEAWQSQNSAADSFVLFPTADALPLEEVASEVRCLIVPDGTWAQGRRIARRHPACAPLRKVCLTGAPRSVYTLRRSYVENGLCTLEAVAYALQALEGDGCAAPMLAAFQQWLARALIVRAGAHDMRELPAAANIAGE
jgi:DTW domain-containing protein YfiP